MSYYQVLGVPRSATDAEIRRAYLNLARQHHPDHHGSSSRETQSEAAQQMRAINEAWHQLGDRERRRVYDAQLNRTPTEATLEEEAEFVWRPYEDSGPDEPTDLRLDDTARRRPRGIRFFSVAPPAVLVVGGFCLLIGLLVKIRPLMAMGFIGLILAALLFVLAPLTIVLESRRHDRL